MSQYSRKGLSKAELCELNDQLAVHAPSLLSLMSHLKQIQCSSEEIQPTNDHYKCPPEWNDLISALASSSPVCALIKPTDEVFTLLKKLKEEDITRDPKLMSTLQLEVPVLFKLLSSIHAYPKHVLGPIVDRLVEAAEAPFVDGLINVAIQALESTCDESLGYFPSLPVVRRRKIYGADSIKGKICTKKSYGHPVLLPGIFTMYCKHGKCSTCK